MNEWEWQLLEDKSPVSSIRVGDAELTTGSRVILQPRSRADIFDMALNGKTAIIQAIEQDYEGKLQLAVVLVDDPGRDLGMKRQPGHLFFYSPEEVLPAGGGE